MLNEVIGIFLQGTIAYDNGIGYILNQWAEFGLFSYVLPFLLIFVLIFGLLTTLRIFNQKVINGIIALSVGLMALQFDFVPTFFSEIFPRAAVGLVIILLILIFSGMFTPDKGWVKYTLWGISLFIFVVVLIRTAGFLGWSHAYWWYENWASVALGLGVLVVIAVIVGAGSNDPDHDVQIPLPIWGGLSGKGRK